LREHRQRDRAQGKHENDAEWQAHGLFSLCGKPTLQAPI
jgi:hypothetical protein